jgi:hypothetical protein
MPEKPLPKVHVTAEDLKAMPEYSASLPTGTYIGKRWKCQVGPDRDSGRKSWWIGEYHDINDPKNVGIRWHEVWLVDRYTTPAEPHPNHPQKCVCHTTPYQFGACPACVAWRLKHER